MKNRKGFLLAEETLKLVIAVIAIGFLVYLLFSLYFSVKSSRELELAKASLNFLMSEINSGKDKVNIYNPSDWNLGTWPHKYEVQTGVYPVAGGEAPKTELVEGKPQTCYNLGFQKCICFCKENTPSSCDSNGLCLNNPQGFEIVGDFATERNIKIINPPVTLNIDQANKKISRT